MENVTSGGQELGAGVFIGNVTTTTTKFDQRVPRHAGPFTARKVGNCYERVTDVGSTIT